MTLGHRERKKHRTRRALVDAAVRLFDANGYAETTVAAIAAAADVSTKTFFNYFAAKDDVLFADTRSRLDAALAVLADRQPDESMVELLARLRGRIVGLIADADVDPDLVAVRVRLVLTVPALQARALHVLLGAQRQLAAALRRAFPEQLDETDAAAVIGAFFGAALVGPLISAERGASLRRVSIAADRGFDIALNGIRSIDAR